MRRLFLQIYLGFVAIALVLLILGGAAQWLEWRRRPPPAVLTGVVEMIGAELSEGDDGGGDGPALQQKLADLARRLRVDATLWSPTGGKLAAVGRTIGPPALDGDPEQWLHRKRHSPGVAVRLEDGRWLGLALAHSRHEGAHWPIGLLAIAGVIALGAYPVARRITRRLERLRAGVEELGRGDLSARVPIEGRDEVADLARSFNRAAERIESLVGTQRRLLASASHELRTPLARLRVAVELLGTQAGARPELVREAAADIAELDELIEDLLLAARLEGAPERHEREPVELLALLAEEGAHCDAIVTGEPATTFGDPRLLRRLVRNLLENARRHGGGTPIEASVRPLGEGAALLEVSDRGPGIPASERERVFEAFYRRAGHSEGRDGGVGLGLALVREIARFHGGDARVRDREGGGTRIEVELHAIPRAADSDTRSK